MILIANFKLVNKSYAVSFEKNCDVCSGLCRRNAWAVEGRKTHNYGESVTAFLRLTGLVGQNGLV